MNKKKILITGGCGFIGTNLCQELLEDNEIILADYNIENNAVSYTNLDKMANVKIIKFDIMDYEQVQSIVKDVEIIVHLAAKLGVQNVINNSSDTIRINFIGTKVRI